MKTIDNIRFDLDGRYQPKIAAAIVLCLALACWALVAAIVLSLL